MTPEPSKAPNRFIPICKWGGCFTALIFAVSGLLLEVTSPGGDAFDSLGRGIWVIVTISVAVGLTGVILDRSDPVLKS